VLNLWPIGLLALVAVVAVLPISSFIFITSLKYVRHALPVTVVLIGIWGAAAAQVLWSLSHFNRRWLPPLAGAALLAVTAVPYAVQDAALVQQYTKVQTQQVLWRWADANVPLDGLILMDARSHAEDTWNRPWSGYDGSKSFQWWFEDVDVIAKTDPADYAQRGIVYFAMSDADVLNFYKTPEAKALAGHFTHIKTIVPGPDTTGDTYSFYRIQPPGQQVDVDFGGQIRLAGYDLKGGTAKPGEGIVFRPYWRIDEQPTTNYSLFVHLYPADEDKLITQYDGAPGSPTRPTLTWDDPDELYIGPDAALTVPADLPPGSYRLIIGLYDYSTGARLSVGPNQSYYAIPVTVG
jgi:hypothetical protein